MTINRWLKVSDELNDAKLVTVSGAVGAVKPTMLTIRGIGSDPLILTWQEWQALLPLVNKLTKEWRAVACDVDAEHEAMVDANERDY